MVPYHDFLAATGTAGRWDAGPPPQHSGCSTRSDLHASRWAWISGSLKNIAPQPSACHLIPRDKDGTQGVESCDASILIERDVGDGSTLRAGTLCPVPQPGIHVFVATREGGDVIVRKNLPWLGEALHPHGALTQELLHLNTL